MISFIIVINYNASIKLKQWVLKFWTTYDTRKCSQYEIESQNWEAKLYLESDPSFAKIWFKVYCKLNLQK